MLYTYTAKNKDGEIISGNLDALSEESAVSILQQAGLVVLKLERKSEEKKYAKALSFFERVSLKELSAYTRQLSILMEAQIPLIESLNALASQTVNSTLKSITIQISSDIEAGLSFSDALSKYPAVFSDFFVNMIKASELTGRLDSSLSYLADYYETQDKLNSKVRNAMIYPIFVLVMFLVVMIIMVVVVIPQLEGVITESGITPDELPTISRIMFGVGNFLKNYYLGIIAAISVIAIVVVNYFKSEEAQGLASTLFLNFPVIGNFLKKLYISRFAETLSVLIKGGIPIVSALEISANVIGNNFYEDTILKIAQGIKEGSNMSTLIMNYPEFFPPVVSQMMAVGERTGTLDQILDKIAKNYSREVDELAGSLTEIIQPILIVFLGILVGLLVAGVIMPIYQIAQQF